MGFLSLVFGLLLSRILFSSRSTHRSLHFVILEFLELNLFTGGKVKYCCDLLLDRWGFTQPRL